VRFDNEEAWFKACMTAGNTAPINIAHLIEARDMERPNAQDVYSAKDRERMKTEAVMVAINLLRGALTIHRRATEEGTTAPFDSLLAYRLEQASKQLPDGWKVVVMAERGKVQVDLYDAADERQPVRHAEDPSEAVLAAIQFATAIRPKSVATPSQQGQQP
jgi:hypothetical protein